MPKAFGFPASSLSSEKSVVSKIIVGGGGGRCFVAFAALTIPNLSDNESLYSTEGGQGELKETNRLICLKNQRLT